MNTFFVCSKTLCSLLIVGHHLVMLSLPQSPNIGRIKGVWHMVKEGQVRIPSGCAISGVFSREGRRICGDRIISSISVMHDRSNGLGGGFAGYGIYPEYQDAYAFHVF